MDFTNDEKMMIVRTYLQSYAGASHRFTEVDAAEDIRDELRRVISILESIVDP